MPGREPEVQVRPPSPERAQPTSEEPPLKKRPTWKAETTVEPYANVSGSTSVRCWLVVLVNGSLLMRLSATLAEADRTATSPASVTTAATPELRERTIARH